MSDSNVAERLKTFIESRDLSYSQFADMCGIPRPSLSQLLTGRNKKISDILVGQIHNVFPELSILWLLFGEGPMDSTIGATHNSEPRQDDSLFPDSLFSMEENPVSDSKKIVFTSGSTERPQKSQGNGLKIPSEDSKGSDILLNNLQKKIKDLQREIDILKKNPRKVASITIYYDDSTFETFYPKDVK